MTTQNQIINEIEKLIIEQQPNYFVTLAFNDYQTPYVADRKLKKFSALLDGFYLGRKFYKKPIEERTLFFAFAEHMESNFHYHLAVVVKDEQKPSFEIMADFFWWKIVNNGSTKIISKYSDDFIPYILKELHKPNNYESYRISTEFMPQK